MKVTRKIYPVYEGPLTYNVMSAEVRRAHHIYTMQRQRCNNPKNASYCHYGARGISVEYTSREFIGWWLTERQEKPWIKFPQTGRIDHSKNYSLDNIHLIERSENGGEVQHRLGKINTRLVKVVAETSDGIRLYFDSLGECARVCGVNRTLLLQHLAGKIESPISQLKFRYLTTTSQVLAERKALDDP